MVLEELLSLTLLSHPEGVHSAETTSTWLSRPTVKSTFTPSVDKLDNTSLIRLE